MNWPIPDIPHKKSLKKPSIKFLTIVFILLICLGALTSIFLLKVHGYRDVIINGLLPSGLIWLCLVGIVWFRYDQASNAAILWEVQTQITKSHWQRWTMWQRPIVANIILCPEKNGSEALIGEPSYIPAYPVKCRRLHHNFLTLSSKLSFLDKNLEEQCPGYRNDLHDIIVLITEKHDVSSISQAVFKQWDMIPDIVSEIDQYFAGSESCSIKGNALIITLQDWPNSIEREYSEFINANLICSSEMNESDSLLVKAGVGRFLHSDSLTKSLDVLTEYNRLVASEMKHVWLSGIGEADMITIVRYAEEKKWALPSRHPFLIVNHSFGPPGPLSFPVSISLLVDAAIRTGETQLLISGGKDKAYSFCLITRRLFL
ncbi:hypothetical protein IAE30_26790 [Pantoea sp. S61]|uniref:hypothetical protein n=1 Tax=Pantoea sp. S61 TaxID=2767442 RepID=UPI00190B22B8|nr:hypothetical protein [Pantoea sp. S61]MBK0127355.1 hypothetical protein [Pantoea sp. S61]